MTLKQCILGFLINKGAEPEVVRQILEESSLEFPGFTSEVVDPEQEYQRLEFLFQKFQSFTKKDIDNVDRIYDGLVSKVSKKN